MPNPEPIQQRIDVTADTGGADEVVRSLEGVQQEISESTRAGVEAARANRELDGELAKVATTVRDLAEAEDEHQQKLVRGEAVTEAEAQASINRQGQIRGLVEVLDDEAERQERVNTLIASAGREARAAAAAEKSRAEVLADKRVRIEALVREQDRYERELEAGASETRQTREAERQRRQEIERLGRELADERRIQERVTEATRDSRRATQDQADASRGAADGFRALQTSAGALGVSLTAAGGLLGTLRLISGELENIRDLRRDAFGSQDDLASAERTLKLNLTGAEDDDIARVFQAAQDIAERNGLGRAAVTQALADAVSASGGDIDAAISNVDLAARVRPDRPGDIAGIAGAIGDIGRAIDTDSSTEALGFLLSVGASSRVADTNQVFRNVPAAVTALVAAGFTPQEAGGLFAAQSVGAADLTGEQTRTASISFGNQLADFFAERERTERGGAAIGVLQRDAALREQFLGGLSLEQSQIAPARELVAGTDSEQAGLFADATRRIGTADQLEAEARRQLDRLATGDAEVVADSARRLAGATDALLNRNQVAAQAGAIQENLTALLQASGESALSQRLGNLDFTVGSIFGDDAIGQAVELIQARRRELPAGRPRDTLSETIQQLLTLRQRSGSTGPIGLDSRSQAFRDQQELARLGRSQRQDGFDESRERQIELIRGRLSERGLTDEAIEEIQRPLFDGVTVDVQRLRSALELARIQNQGVVSPEDVEELRGEFDGRLSPRQFDRVVNPPDSIDSQIPAGSGAGGISINNYGPVYNRTDPIADVSATQGVNLGE